MLQAILAILFVTTCHGYNSENHSGIDSYAMNCTMPGYFCSTCKEVVLCQPQPDGSLISSVIDTCLGNQTCFAKASGSAQCTSEYNEDCDPSIEAYQFTCKQIGIFPDPFNCTKFHLCKEEDMDKVSKGVVCPTGFGFDTRRLLCSTKLIDGKCKRPVSPCRNPGINIGPIPGNLNFYYQCYLDNNNTRVPFVFHCPNDFIYIEKNNGYCVDPSLPQNVDNGLCRAEGQFYHPNCQYYNLCTAPNATSHTTLCSVGYYFDPKISSCRPIYCDMIQ